MTARYYFEDIDAIVTLLESKPTSNLSILVGSNNLQADIQLVTSLADHSSDSHTHLAT